VEAEFRQTEGVLATAAGYAGGTTDAPSYEQVCAGRTGHTEVVQVEFDPLRVSYEQLLDVFFKTHNPCSAKKSQYQSVIFTHSEAQAQAAHAAKAKLERSNGRQVATVVEPIETFWRAEEYHQQYYEKSGVGRARAGVGSL